MSETKQYKCEYCGKRFIAQTELDVHFDVHVIEKPYPCPSCNKRFRTESALNSHALVHSKTKRLFSCDACRQTFHRKARLEAHAKIHTGESPFNCDQCGESFRAQNQLNKHLRMAHTERKVYPCEICHLQFDKRVRLEIHLISHARERPCDLCNRGMDCGGHFEGHLKIHEREKMCRLCGQSFDKWPNLIKHVSRVHGKKKEKLLAMRMSRYVYEMNEMEESLGRAVSLPEVSPVDASTAAEFGSSHWV